MKSKIFGAMQRLPFKGWGVEQDSIVKRNDTCPN
jgi:hypothetical protein